MCAVLQIGKYYYDLYTKNTHGKAGTPHRARSVTIAGVVNDARGLAGMECNCKLTSAGATPHLCLCLCCCLCLCPCCCLCQLQCPTGNIVALRDIQVGEELFYDYGDDYWLDQEANLPPYSNKNGWMYID